MWEWMQQLAFFVLSMLLALGIGVLVIAPRSYLVVGGS
jgi:hydroxylamine reductase (hybrid-cluster protein)